MAIVSKVRQVEVGDFIQLQELDLIAANGNIQDISPNGYEHWCDDWQRVALNPVLPDNWKTYIDSVPGFDGEDLEITAGCFFVVENYDGVILEVWASFKMFPSLTDALELVYLKLDSKEFYPDFEFRESLEAMFDFVKKTS